jgi:Fe-S cluster assembly protein SufB
MAVSQQTIETVRSLTGDYKYGFVSDIESELAPKGLNDDTVRFISAKKSEPQWLLDWRLKALHLWQQEQEHEPTWAHVTYPKIDYQEISYYAAPKAKKQLKSLSEIDPELLRTYEKLGIPLKEVEMLAGVAVDAVFDSISVATTFKDKLKEVGIIFCPISEACTSIRSWSASISAVSFRTVTTTSRR